jgi:RNA polymerase sigma-70 factor (ECF subfamily)
MNARDPTALSTSRTLLARVQSNDAHAWDQLVDLYAPCVLRWCRGYALPPEDIADLFQDVFCAAARHIATFRKERPQDTFRGWLRTIVANKVRDHYRRRRRDGAAVGGSEQQAWLLQSPAPADATKKAGDTDGGGDGVSELLQRALERVRGALHEKTWLAFAETVLAARSVADVAEELSMTAGAVRVAKCRVLQRLREELGDVD